VAQSSTGKWVSRVGAAGGGKTYRKARPLNYYAIIALIVLLGSTSILYSRYERHHPILAAQPAVGTTWYAGFASEVCGMTGPSINNAVMSPASAFSSPATNVIAISPKTSAQAGDNATVGAFLGSAISLSYDKVSFTLPGASVTKPTTYKNGDTCPSGTPDAGKKGVVSFVYWPSLGVSKATTVSDPRTLKFTNLMRFAFVFGPHDAKPFAFPSATSSKLFSLYQALQASGGTTTTSPIVTSSTSTTLVTTTTVG
jgi:hypothetical protein